MTRRVFRATIVTLLAWALLAPTLSEVGCKDVCTGSACGEESAPSICDLDASDECCTPASSAAEAAPNPGIPTIGDACSICPCFEDNPFDIFILSKSFEFSRLTPVPISTPRAGGMYDLFLQRLYAVECLTVETHGPPLYQQHHALLL
jgi:hypothetical protein